MRLPVRWKGLCTCTVAGEHRDTKYADACVHECTRASTGVPLKNLRLEHSKAHLTPCLSKTRAGLQAWRQLSEQGLMARRAIAFYAARDEYMCSTIINVARLEWLGTDPSIDRIVIIPKTYTPKERHLAALKACSVHIVEAPALTGPDNDTELFYRDCMAKLFIFSLADYQRIVYMDADSIVRRNLDWMFDLPEVDVAAPRAYWIDPGRPRDGCEDKDPHVGHLPYVGLQMKFTSALMVIMPSERTWMRLRNKYFPVDGPARLAHGMFDMVCGFLG